MMVMGSDVDGQCCGGVELFGADLNYNFPEIPSQSVFNENSTSPIQTELVCLEYVDEIILMCGSWRDPYLISSCLGIERGGNWTVHSSLTSNRTCGNMISPVVNSTMYIIRGSRGLYKS